MLWPVHSRPINEILTVLSISIAYKAFSQSLFTEGRGGGGGGGGGGDGILIEWVRHVDVVTVFPPPHFCREECC